jgi:dipeptidyl aminopeptidase/acylaminoacyl peptidase
MFTGADASALITHWRRREMRVHVIGAFAGAVAMVACGGAQPPVEQARTAPSKTYTMEQLLENVAVGGGSFNADETKLLVHTNQTGVFNVYSLDIATGERTPITEGTDTTFSVGYFPQDDRILFTRDQQGNEVNHVYLREPDGTVRDLTRGDETKEQFGGFAWDLQSFYTLNNGRDSRFFDMYEWDVDSLEPRLIYQNETGMTPAGMSPDKRWLALSKPNTTNDSDIYLLDLESGGEPVLISEHEGQAQFSVEDFSSDNRWMYYTTNVDGEFMVLKRYDVETGDHEDVYRTDWDVVGASFSRTDRYRVIAVNEDGIYRLKITDMATGEDIEIPGLPEGEVLGVSFSLSETKMRFYVTSDTMPANLYLYDFETAELRRLTDTLNPDIDPADMVASDIARFQARDGMTIPGPLYKPIGAGPDNKVPVIVWVHGGPGGQSTPGWSAERQFLLNNGYGIFAANNRGSSGYGKSFLAADDQRHGQEPLWDCVDAKEWLKTLDWVDPDRIGILGGSYGGYMVLAALAYEPEEFSVGVDIFGVANWVRTLESIPPWWESFREALYQEIGHPEDDAEMLRQYSPVFHADKITKPLLILQGANDPRVLKAESDDMVEAIRANNGIVEYVVFDDEGHGFTKSANRIQGWNTVLTFLDTYLAAPDVAPPAD